MTSAFSKGASNLQNGSIGIMAKYGPHSITQSIIYFLALKIRKIEATLNEKKIIQNEFSYSWVSNVSDQNYIMSQFALDLVFTKGQLISKSLFCVFNFLQKTNKNKSYISKNECIRSFFGGNRWLQKPFRKYLTFTMHL